MGKASRERGKRGERELAASLRGHGYDCRRRYRPAGIHIEAKRTERLNLHDVLAQSIHDARPGELPAVFNHE